MIKQLLDFLYPPKCPFCGRVFLGGICDDCSKKILVIQEPYCMRCGKPVKDDAREFCYDCEHKKHHYEYGRSLWLHKPPVSDAIYAFKYENKRIYGEIFAKELAKAHISWLKREKIDCIIPIPLSRSRRWKRGYNQTEILAENLGKYTRIPVVKNALIRVKNTRAQKELNDIQRKKNISGAFSVKGKIDADTVLVLDDIYTTGSTIDEAAITLKKAGIKKVYFLTVSIGQGY